MVNYCAVLMDTISIQKYVFASNRLLDNLGASQIVGILFKELAVSSLADACSISEEETQKIMSKWRENPELLLMKVDPGMPFEIGVSGGGKALIFFRDPAHARQFIKQFSRQMLIQAPGLQLATAVNEKFILDDQCFSEQLTNLYKELTRNRNRYFALTELPHHGITAVCPKSGTSLNMFDEKEKNFISQGTVVKQKAAKVEQDKRNSKLAEKHSNCRFTNQLDQLGQQEGDSYTAVIHIDGNNMGKWFQQSTDLIDYRKRSINMAQITEDSFWCLVDKVVSLIPECKDEEQGFDLKKDQYKYFLPIRPVIIGGDDITFICHAKLALYLAEEFLRVWRKKANSDSGLTPFGLPENREFSACAGVVIAKTKYPFYRTYQFAEQSCATAKRSARHEETGLWIDFQLISGTKSGSLEKIREDDKKAHGIKLYFGPYCIEDKNKKSIQGLKSGILLFAQDKYWAKNKLKELRTAFNLGEEVVDNFITGMKAQNGSLPAISQLCEKSKFKEKGFADKETPYPDILEMMDFYPIFLLKGGA